MYIYLSLLISYMYQLHIMLGCHSSVFTNAELNEISHLQQSTTTTTITTLLFCNLSMVFSS